MRNGIIPAMCSACFVVLVSGGGCSGNGVDHGEMVFVKGGAFPMGGISNEGRSDEIPVPTVVVKSYFIGKYEVTVDAFREFVRETEYSTDAARNGGAAVWTGTSMERMHDADWQNPYFKQTGDSPVVCIGWYDALRYCNWRSRHEGLQPCYQITRDSVTCNFSAKGYRLPTEAEWEFAARSRGGDHRYSWGNGYPHGKNGGNILDESSKTLFSMIAHRTDYDDGYAATAPVGQFVPNEIGIHDMTGNVWEWCWDGYDEISCSTRSAKGPAGPGSGDLRVLRGGSFGAPLEFCRCTLRRGVDPADGDFDWGFRLVRTF